MRLLFITNIPAPYRVDFFNELGKYCDLTVIFEKITSDERNINWCSQNFQNFEGIVLKGISINTDTAICPGIIGVLKYNIFDHIIIANSYSPTGMIAIAYCRIYNIPFFNEADGGFAKSGKGIKELFKRKLIESAIGSFSTSSTLDEYFSVYGVKKEHIYRYPFTSLRQKDILPNTITYKQRNELRDRYREKNNIPQRPLIVAVGQFIYRKGFDVLIESMALLPKEYYLYIIGGNGKEYSGRVKELQLNNIDFIEFLNKEKLKEYYLAADLFVHPTREDIWGLVINEAMACALPVITTTRCVAGLELVHNGKNGYLVKPDNKLELADKIYTILSDTQLKDKMGFESLKRIQEYSIENMAQRHVEVLSNFSYEGSTDNV